MTNEADERISNTDLLAQTTDIVSAYVSNNPINSSDLSNLMQSIHAQLGELANGQTQDAPPEPAVPIKNSVTDAHIICLEDGKKLKMLKRYIRSRYNLSPEEYKARWNLPADYPMVAPEYARRRSDFAKEIGLGKSGK